ncbi:MAG: methyltransferase C-terminal domain-containing protein [Terrimicrobiaceae bacterium]
MLCRHCRTPLSLIMADLGTSPPSNSYVEEADLSAPEKWYPLRVHVCTCCWLAQTADFVDREECFSTNYAYFSSCSPGWVRHAATYAQEMISKRQLGADSLVVEVACNDGYLLQHFKNAGVPCYGIEPTTSTGSVARSLGIDVVPEFFGSALAKRLVGERGHADLIAANNVLAHVPDINDFAAGFATLLKPGGLATFEFPHLLQLLEKNYFDTIYHEHFSYLSLHAVKAVFGPAGLTVVDIEELPTHGGSLRVHAMRSDSAVATSPRVGAFLAREQSAGLLGDTVYRGFQKKVEKARTDFLRFLLDAREAGRRVAAYGAAAKGNTLLNFAGVKPDLIEFVVDRSPGKIGRYLPGSRIPILPESALSTEKPDIIVILPWNLRDEVSSQISYAREWGAKFVVALPKLEVL